MNLTLAQVSRRSFVVTAVILLAGAFVLMTHREFPLLKEIRNKDLPIMFQWDSQSYYFMAIGRYNQVASPFSKRPLYPWLAKGLSHAAGIRIESAFMCCNIAAFALLAFCMAAALEIMLSTPWPALVVLLTPFPVGSLELGYMPDLFHTALTALFFLLLIKDKVGWALLVLLVCFATRESTLLLCLTCMGFGYVRRHRLLLFGSFGVLVFGMIYGSIVAKLGKPNLHHMPELLYLALKVPYNFLLNFTGIGIWSEIANIGKPTVKWPTPHFLQRFMTDKELGLVIDWRLPVQTLTFYLTVFGIGPALAWRFVRNRAMVKTAPLPVQMAFFYGLICYVVGPTLGNLTDRLIAYGWPLYWIAVPYLMRPFWQGMNRRYQVLLLSLFLVAAWWPSAVGWASTKEYLLSALAILVYVPTFFLLRQCWAESAKPLDGSMLVTKAS